MIFHALIYAENIFSKKKQFYEINDNLIRFYFTYIFGKQSIFSGLGEDAFYQLYVQPSINEFISRRFESIVLQYFQRQIRNGNVTDVYDFGSYWYDDPRTRQNGEFHWFCLFLRFDFTSDQYLLMTGKDLYAKS